MRKPNGGIPSAANEEASCARGQAPSHRPSEAHCCGRRVRGWSGHKTRPIGCAPRRSPWRTKPSNWSSKQLRCGRMRPRLRMCCALRGRVATTALQGSDSPLRKKATLGQWPLRCACWRMPLYNRRALPARRARIARCLALEAPSACPVAQRTALRASGPGPVWWRPPPPPRIPPARWACGSGGPTACSGPTGVGTPSAFAADGLPKRRAPLSDSPEPAGSLARRAQELLQART